MFFKTEISTTKVRVTPYIKGDESEILGILIKSCPTPFKDFFNKFHAKTHLHLPGLASLTAHTLVPLSDCLLLMAGNCLFPLFQKELMNLPPGTVAESSWNNQTAFLE